MSDQENSDKVHKIVQPFLAQINSTPELLSLLYDIDMLPEQTVTIPGAIRLAAFCCVWKRMRDAELSLSVWDEGRNSEYWLRYSPEGEASEVSDDR